MTVTEYQDDDRSQEERMKDGKPFAVKVTRNVTPLMIGYAFCGAFEGGSNYWLHSAELVSSDFPKKPGLVWYGADHMFDGEFEFDIEFDAEDGEEGDNGGRMRINRAAVEKGLALMAEKEPGYFNDLADLNGNADSITYDVFMQFVVFGKLIYG